MDAQERWLSVDEIAVHLGISAITVYRWVEKQRIPAHRVGRQWRFLVSEVNEWVKRGEANENQHDEVSSSENGLPSRSKEGQP